MGEKQGIKSQPVGQTDDQSSSGNKSSLGVFIGCYFLIPEKGRSSLCPILVLCMLNKHPRNRVRKKNTEIETERKIQLQDVNTHSAELLIRELVCDNGYVKHRFLHFYLFSFSGLFIKAMPKNINSSHSSCY